MWGTKGGCSGQQGDTKGLWAPEDVTLAGSALSDPSIATAGSTGTTPQWQLPPRLWAPHGPTDLGGPRLPRHSTAAHGSGITAVLREHSATAKSSQLCSLPCSEPKDCSPWTSHLLLATLLYARAALALEQPTAE